jgi:hypothetical protein
MLRTRLTAGITAWALSEALIGPGCTAQTTAPSPPPDTTTQVTPIDSTGPVRISFVSANVAAGSAVAGCGPLIEGCAGRLKMTFLLNPPSDGPVLYVRVYLHAANLIACLWGETAPLSVQAGVPTVIEIAIDRADRCGTPTTISTMATVVEGPIQVASRQTWSLHYVFNP